MTDVTAASLTFLPWVRQGVAAAINTPDTLGKLRGVIDLTAGVKVNGATTPSVTMPVRLRGPADVVGIDPNQVIRTDPHPGTSDFEPNCFPCVEFDRADFPWLFTPASAGANAKLRPWLCLVVVRKQDGITLTTTPDSPLPVLQIAASILPASELPDLGECWAWAHAQAAGDDSSEGAVRNALNGSPDRSLSRLICPRILAPNTDYMACVVPTFDFGRRAGPRHRHPGQGTHRRHGPHAGMVGRAAAGRADAAACCAAGLLSLGVPHRSGRRFRLAGGAPAAAAGPARSRAPAVRDWRSRVRPPAGLPWRGDARG
jgi:hypothetical protein